MFAWGGAASVAARGLQGKKPERKVKRRKRGLPLLVFKIQTKKKKNQLKQRG